MAELTWRRQERKHVTNYQFGKYRGQRKASIRGARFQSILSFSAATYKLTISPKRVVSSSKQALPVPARSKDLESKESRVQAETKCEGNLRILAAEAKIGRALFKRGTHGKAYCVGVQQLI